MNRILRAVYENGAFRPLEPVSCQEHEAVLLTVLNPKEALENLVDEEFHAYCETQADDAVSLEEVRRTLSQIPGSLMEDLRAERARR